MRSSNEFWLNLHWLADAYDAEGRTMQESCSNILREFRQMPGVAQREVLTELKRLAIALPLLYPVVASTAGEVDGERPAAASSCEGTDPG